MEITSPNELEVHSTSISTKVEECPKIDETVNESSSGNNNDDSDHSSDSESSKSDKEHEVNFATRKSLESSSGNTNDSDHNSNSESSKSDNEHEVNFDTKPPLEPSSGNTNDNSNHDSGSDSSESDKEREVNFATKHHLEKEIDIVTNNLKQPPPSDTTIEECYESSEVVNESTITNSNDDINCDTESSKSDKEQPLDKVIDLVTNDLKESLISTTSTIEECPKIDEGVYASANRNTIEDMDHNSANESSESDKEQEVVSSSIGQSLVKETDMVTNELKQSPLITTSVEECPKTDEVTYGSTIKNVDDDKDNVSESTENDKEHEIEDFAIGQSSEKETNLVTNDLKQSTLISTTVEECPKADEVPYESVVKNINDDMDNVSESTESDKEHEILNVSIGQSSEKETDLVTNDSKQSLLINSTIEECPTTHEVVYESNIIITNDDMDHSSGSESPVGDKQQKVFNFPSNTEPDIATNDMEQFPLQNDPAEFVNQVSSDDEGHKLSMSYGDVHEEFASGFNIIRAFHRSVSMESVESLDGSNVSEIEGENIVDRLKRQVEYDKKCIISLYKELDEERSASEVAASQAMAMITRLQEEKAAMHMEALHYLRMMEEQAEYDVEALEKANELLNEKERDIQDLEAELEYYRSNFMVDTIAETEHEKSDGANEENIAAENDIVGHYECNGIGNYSFKSIIVESSKASYRSFNNQSSCLEFEDEKIYIQLCLKSLENKINKIFTNGLIGRVPNTIDTEEEMNSEQKGEENIDDERSQRNNEENGTVTPKGEFADLDKNSHFGSEENFSDVKCQISCANKREEVDFLALEHKISDLTGRLETLQADYDFLEHSLNSLRYGEEGLQFAQNIVHQLQELCKLGIKLDRQPGS